MIRPHNLTIALLVVLFAASLSLAADPAPPAAYRVFVSNERSGDVSVIDGSSATVVATLPVGKRPRGIHGSADGRFVYVAVSGTPIEEPPKLDANGNPIFKPGHAGGPAADDDDDAAKSDHDADGIVVIDAQQLKVLRKLSAGSDPEQFAVTADGSKLLIANEDVATASVMDVTDGKVRQILRVGKEPEGVGFSPDGSRACVTCETTGEVYVVDTATWKSVGKVTVGGRPRSVVFLPDKTRAIVPSESAGELHLIDVKAQQVLQTIKLPPGFRPMGTALSADAKELYVGAGRSGMVCVVSADTLDLLAPIKVGGRPWGVTVSPDGKLLYSANGPTNDVSIIDVGTRKEVGRGKAGQSPWGVTVVREAAH